MANEKILVVDDDTNICELLRLYLTKEGYQVTVANDGEEGLEKFNQVKPDMVLLDVMMPKMDGLEVCRRIRKAGNTPVMMLTAKGETFDKVLGLELGADDYMVKPFDAKEVVARIKAVLRRCQTTTAAAESTEGVIEFDNLRLDMNSYELRVKGKVVEAPPKELELLNCLASHPNRVYTRDQLLDEVWGFEYYGDSRTIDVLSLIHILDSFGTPRTAERAEKSLIPKGKSIMKFDFNALNFEILDAVSYTHLMCIRDRT